MRSLIFEMSPRDGHEDHYFAHAAKLRPLVMKQEGLLFIERFKSLSRDNVILSHSIWRDEQSIALWRSDKDHQVSQLAGRNKHFEDYRIRISHVLDIFDEAIENPLGIEPNLSDEAETTTDRFLVIKAITEQPSQAQGEVFESVAQKNSYLIIQECALEEEGRLEIAAAKVDKAVNRAHLSRVLRDYGMHDRDEAPESFRDR